MTPDCVDYKTAAIRIGMSVHWLRKQVKSGLVECQRFGRSIRFTEAQIQKIIDDHVEPVAPKLGARRHLAAVPANPPPPPPSGPPSRPPVQPPRPARPVAPTKSTTSNARTA